MSSAPAVSSAAPSKGAPAYTISTGSRPYRSHKVRACDLCRKRKSRCTVDLPGQSCLLCRIQGADCHYKEDTGSTTSSLHGSNTETKQWSPAPATQRKLKRKFEESPIERGPDRNLMNTPSVTAAAQPSSATHRDEPILDNRHNHNGLGGSMNESVHIIGPVAAEDAQVIERYMPSERSRKSPDVKTPYNVYSNDPRKPILYTTVARQRQGVRSSGVPGENQKDIIEQILGPFKHDLVAIFLDKINAPFPIFDEHVFMEAYKLGDGSLPPPLMCQVYAMSLIYWNQSPVLAPHPKPDIRYAVNLAVAALHEEFSAPGLSTLGAALIDLTGRPIFSMTGNAINTGRTVALSHCLGLNRDPSNWKLSQAEKNNRIRLWWAVVIHDRWASYGHGVPSQISRNQYDVPLPTIDMLVPHASATQQRFRAAHGYIFLCRLTEILGDLLPLVYGLQPKNPKDTSKIVRRMRTELDRWEDSLPEWLRSPQIENAAPTSGSSSLQLAFLAVKMLVCRIELQEINHSENSNPEARRYFQTECRKAAEDIVQFLLSLKRPHFQEFWMSYSAYHLTSTATFLFRCALETSDPDIARSCLANVDTFLGVLRRARLEHEWDVADMCLDHCERIVSKHPGINSEEPHASVSQPCEISDTPVSMSMPMPETPCHNDIVGDMMSISGTFGTMDGFPFDMTGIWDVPGLQDQESHFMNIPTSM
ncbi:conserved hypothetical protein [Uncinocarpus reesii 1704]|uniref:Zn(2)-C6 fungal-type domain-containing protein n=1 Tax=Uncinocarpus reesii (strain UAMH 1704) TaxID=336963 RepID=C4JJC6_UNCRE|nr:uncharacterized protein UREG_01733 [Uncinocarpus reesii 1704]EEP76884.1 conserved hypothetical protein [Uncinocarpus reesii 1704]